MIEILSPLPREIHNTFIIDVTDPAAFHVRKAGDGGDLFVVDTTNNLVTIVGALLGDGVLIMAETITPSAIPGFGKLYTKNDNVLYFQDGAGVEHALAYA